MRVFFTSPGVSFEGTAKRLHSGTHPQRDLVHVAAPRSDNSANIFLPCCRMRLSTTAALTTLVAMVAAAPLPEPPTEDNLVEAHEEGLLLLVPTLPADGSVGKNGKDLKRDVRACVCFVVHSVNSVPSIFLHFLTFHFFANSFLSLYLNSLPSFYYLYSRHPLRSTPFNYMTFCLCVLRLYPELPPLTHSSSLSSSIDNSIPPSHLSTIPPFPPSMTRPLTPSFPVTG